MISNEGDSFCGSDFYEYNTPHFSNDLLSSLFNLQKSGILCDVTFTSDDTTISAHSCLLAAISPFMARFINSCERSVSSPLSRYNLPITLITKMVSDSIENCMDCLSQVVGYIYSGNIVISLAHFQHIANISCNLEINELIAICREFKHNNNVLINSGSIFEGKNDNMKLDFYISGEEQTNNLNDVKDRVKNKIILTKRKSTSSDCSPARKLSKSLPSDFYECKSFETCTSEKLILSELPNISNVKDESDLLATCGYCTFSDEEVSVIPYDIKDHEFTVNINKGKNIKSSTEVTNDVILPEEEEKKLRASIISCVDKDFQTDLLKVNFMTKKTHASKLNASRVVYKTETEADFKSELNFGKNVSCNSLYSCLECRNVFNCIDSLLKHRSEYHSYKYICIYCNFKCNSLQNITKHLLITKHGNKCSICFGEFDNQLNFLKHCHRSHHFVKKFTCFMCDAVFESRNKFKNHLKTHKVPEKIKCKLCCEEFFNEVEMGVHLNKKHKSSSVSCEFCSYKTKYPCYLKRHMLKHNRKLLSCSFPDCNFQTVWLHNLKEHCKIHGKCRKKFSCNICNVQFSLKKNLMRHYFYFHGTSKEFSCPLCNYNNKRIDKVRAHYRSNHEGNKEALVLLNNQLPLNYYEDELIIKENLNSFQTNENSKSSTFPKNNVESSAAINENSRIVYLNENTGDLTFFCDSNGKPLKGVPDVITVHSINTINNSCNFDGNNPTNSTSVILNETTGELTCINLNFDCNMECRVVEKPCDQNPETAVTVLDETTGEITSKNEQIPFENENITDLNNIFDTIDFEAMNDDSFDGFDDFDNALFDAEFSIGSASPDMDKILNEYTGELFTDNSTCRFTLSKQMNSALWENNRNKSSDPSNSQQFAEIFLDEVTGEFSGLINYN